MTEEMLAKIRPPSARYTDRPLWLSICLVAAISAAILLPMVYMVWYTFHWRDYISAISASTSQAYRFGSLEGTVEGNPVQVTGPHMYALYDRLTAHMGKLYRHAPEEAPRIDLQYSSGATLEIWEVSLDEDDAVAIGQADSGGRKYHLLWRFTSAEGEVWIYDTDKDLYRNVWILVAPQQNQS